MQKHLIGNGLALSFCGVVCAQGGGIPSIPPEIIPPKYAAVDKTYFESKFGASFTGGDSTPLLVGAPDGEGWYPLQRVDLSTGSLVLQSAGSVQPTNFRRAAALCTTAQNMVDFVSTDPYLVGVDWSIATQGSNVLANIRTSSEERLRMRGAWLTITVTRTNPAASSVETIFVPNGVQTAVGNEGISGPSENPDDYLPDDMDCEDWVDPEDCAELQACFYGYANCMVNAATTYNNAVQDCDEFGTLVKGIAGGACAGGGAGGLGGSVIPVIGTCIGGAVGIVIGGVGGGIYSYWDCMDDASDTYYNSAAICANNLGTCVDQWVIVHPEDP